MVSQSGGDGVYEYLAERIGKSYVISYVTPKGDAKRKCLLSVITNTPMWSRPQTVRSTQLSRR